MAAEPFQNVDLRLGIQLVQVPPLQRGRGDHVRTHAGVQEHHHAPEPEAVDDGEGQPVYHHKRSNGHSDTDRSFPAALVDVHVH